MALPKVSALLALLLAAPALAADPAPNGLKLPDGYKDWRVIAVSHRTDNNTVRAIVGNDAAMRAAREGKVNPWPDGAVLGKFVWKAAKHEVWEAAIVPGDLVHVEFMVKDAKKYAETGGWGFGRWLGKDQKPYGKDASFVQECFVCHTPMQKADYVFTRLAPLP